MGQEPVSPNESFPSASKVSTPVTGGIGRLHTPINVAFTLMRRSGSGTLSRLYSDPPKPYSSAGLKAKSTRESVLHLLPRYEASMANFLPLPTSMVSSPLGERAANDPFLAKCKNTSHWTPISTKQGIFLVLGFNADFRQYQKAQPGAVPLYNPNMRLWPALNH